MIHLNLVASELHRSGFKTTKLGNRVWARLSNRGITRMEIQHILDEKFEGIEFELHSTGSGVLITVE
jgi:hypothetical protein